jgi:hypothetical protein
MWANMLWQGGYTFETAPPMVTKEGIKPFPPSGARTLDSRTAFYYAYTMDTPAMLMRIPNIGSQYLMGFTDADKNPFDGAKTYKVTLPKNIPAARFWSFTLYDNQTRSMLQTPQRYPRAGSQTYPGCRRECGWHHHGVFRPDQARRREGRHLDSDDAAQGLVHDPALLQPARIVLRQELETERGRVGEVTRRLRGRQGDQLED